MGIATGSIIKLYKNIIVVNGTPILRLLPYDTKELSLKTVSQEALKRYNL